MGNILLRSGKFSKYDCWLIKYCYVWFLKNNKKRKKYLKNNFLMFGFNEKKSQIQLKLIRNFYILKLFNLYKDRIN